MLRQCDADLDIECESANTLQAQMWDVRVGVGGGEWGEKTSVHQHKMADVVALAF